MPKDNRVICGSCELVFGDEKAYLGHTCTATGYKPTQPQHLGANFIRQSKAALERTGSLTPEREQELDALLTEAKSKDVDGKVKRFKVEAKMKRGR